MAWDRLGADICLSLPGNGNKQVTRGPVSPTSSPGSPAMSLASRARARSASSSPRALSLSTARRSRHRSGTQVSSRGSSRCSKGRTGQGRAGAASSRFGRGPQRPVRKWHSEGARARAVFCRIRCHWPVAPIATACCQCNARLATAARGHDCATQVFLARYASDRFCSVADSASISLSLICSWPRALPCHHFSVLPGCCRCATRLRYR